MRTSKLLVLFFAFLLLPLSNVFAHDFQQADSLYFNANSSLYRQRDPNRLWQLVPLPDLTIEQTQVFNGKLHAVVQGASGENIFVENRPLQLDVEPAIATSPKLTMSLEGGWLAVLSQNGSKNDLYLNHSNGFELVTPSLVDSPEQLNELAIIDNQLYLIKPGVQEASVFRYQGGWLLTTNLDCKAGLVIHKPQLLLGCNDGRLLYPVAPDNWQALNLPPLKSVKVSNQIVSGWDLSDDHVIHIWSSGQATSIRLPDVAFNQVEELIVSGRRIVMLVSGQWLELLWEDQSPKLLLISDQLDLKLVDGEGNGQLFLSGDTPLISLSPGSWQPITTQGDFNHARLTKVGWLVWQTLGNTGGLTQFSPNGSTAFVKVNPWSSTTSPVQAVFIGEPTSYVSVITQSGSGNVNLYKTSDQIHWSRITLPTKPTFSPDISQARLLPSGTLVELSGVLTIGPRIVGEEIVYLEDELSGIQLYLSRTNGNLPDITDRRATASGEISSSQVKRITLDTPADLEFGGSDKLTPPTITADQTSNYQGRSVLLKGTVDSLSTDSLYMSQLSATFKVHLEQAKTIFQANDQVLIPAVIDWNSQSAQIEGWTTSANYQLLFRPAPDVVSSSQENNLATHSLSKKATGSVQSGSTRSQPTVKAAAFDKLPENDAEVLVDAESTDRLDSRQSGVLSVVSLMAGLLSMRGRRFRRLLPTETKVK